MTAINRTWRTAFAKQALSDLETHKMLATSGARKCHRLHFPQMAAEKVCKAHLRKRNGQQEVRNVHTYTEKNLPVIARHFFARLPDRKRIANWEMAEIRRLSREIQLLAPACDGGIGREDNTEYPWEIEGENVQVPCEYEFPAIDDSPQKGRMIAFLIRLIRAASEEYAQ